MGVYIKGMDMPKSGEKIIILTSSGYVEDVLGQVIQGVEAVEVKEPHGRLIDVNALEYCDEEEKANNDVFEAVRGSGSGSTIHIYCSGFRDGILTMTSKIRFAPTIIEAEGKDDG